MELSDSFLVGLETQKQYVPKNPLGQAPASNPPLPPTIIVPGLTGSALMNPPGTTRVWINIPQLTTANLQVSNPLNPLTTNNGMDGVVNIAGKLPVGQYFLAFQQWCSDTYSNSETALAAAPYDWRQMPSEAAIDSWATNLKAQVEQLYNNNNNSPVTLLGHSLGNFMILYFLNKWLPNNGGDTWKSQYIKRYVSVGAPFSGAPAATGYTIAGIQKFHVQVFTTSLISNYPSAVWLFPQPSTFDSPIVTVKDTGATYDATSVSVRGLFSKLPDDNGVLTTLNNIIDPLNTAFPNLLHQHPQVMTYLVWSENVAAIQSWTFASLTPVSGATKNPETGNLGDGTVPYISLHGNDSWLTDVPNLTQNFIVQEAGGVNHGNLVSQQAFFDYMQKVYAGTFE